jgi:hypothetical protein
VGASDEKKSSNTNGVHNLTLEERVVETAFKYLGVISKNLRERFNL